MRSSTASSSGAVPIYTGFVSPQKQPRSSSSNAAVAALTVAPTVDLPQEYLHSAPSPSRAAQAAFLRQRSPRAEDRASHNSSLPSYAARFDHHHAHGTHSPRIQNGGNSSDSFAAGSSGSPLLPSMRVRSILDDDDEDIADDADDEATAVESEVEQRRRIHAHGHAHGSHASAAHLHSHLHAAHAATSSPSNPPAAAATHKHSSTIVHPRPPSSHLAAASRTSLSSAAGVAPARGNIAPAAAVTDAQMLSAVQSFLRTHYPPSVSSSRPAVELTSHTLPSLYALAEHVRSESDRAGAIEDDLVEAMREYDAERRRLEGKMERIGVKATMLPASAQAHAVSLVQLAQLLALKNTEPSSYLIGLLSARNDYHSAVDELEDARAERQAVDRRVHGERRLHAELRALQADHQRRFAAARTDAEEKKQQVPFFRVKEQEYQRATQELTHRLESAGFQDHLSHESIVALSGEIDALRAAIHPLDAALSTYQHLPADVTLARIQLAEARQHLVELEDDFARDIRGMQEDDDEDR